MPTGILICGLNGAGKSTLGKALAEKSGFRFLDIEDLYFPRLAPGNPYASPRSRSEVEKLLLQELSTKENFILASVKADYGEAIYPFFQLAVLVDVPKEVRLQRVRNRSFQKFGSRMQPGGDLYEQEQRFFELVESRDENTVTEWLRALGCHVIRVDGLKSVEENAEYIMGYIREKLPGGKACTRLGEIQPSANPPG